MPTTFATGIAKSIFEIQAFGYCAETLKKLFLVTGSTNNKFLPVYFTGATRKSYALMDLETK